jgi:hypothetical protein
MRFGSRLGPSAGTTTWTIALPTIVRLVEIEIVNRPSARV